MVAARCEVMCRIGRGPCVTNNLRILSLVTAAAAATATGECVFKGLSASLLPLLVNEGCRDLVRGTTEERDRGLAGLPLPLTTPPVVVSGLVFFAAGGGVVTGDVVAECG